MASNGHSSESVEPSLAKLDWPRMRAQWLRFASHVLRSTDRARDLVSEALARALDPNDDPWCPEIEPDFARHVMRIISNLNRAEKDKAYLRRDPRWQAAVVERNVSLPTTPEEDALAAERDGREKRLLAEVRKRLVGDPLALQLVDLAEGRRFGRPADQAAATGQPIETIRNARKRVHRVVDAVDLEDRIATETPENKAPS